MRTPRLIRPGHLALLLAAAQPLGACSATPHHLAPQHAPELGAVTKTQKLLWELPLPPEPIAVAVYGFSDQTGQFKPSENGQSLSRAVSQGATSILVKAMEDAGQGGWFAPVEREHLDDLLKERQIIREMRAKYLSEEGINPAVLPPMLYAGVIFEGGVIGFDSNTLTGGAGAKFLGIGRKATSAGCGILLCRPKPRPCSMPTMSKRAFRGERSRAAAARPAAPTCRRRSCHRRTRQRALPAIRTCRAGHRSHGSILPRPQPRAASRKLHAAPPGFRPPHLASSQPLRRSRHPNEPTPRNQKDCPMTRSTFIVTTTALALMASSPALAGKRATIVEAGSTLTAQTAQNGGSNGVIYIDQSGARNVVRQLLPAVHPGQNNTVAGGVVNKVDLRQSGFSNGIDYSQSGQGHDIHFVQGGNDQSARITQSGNFDGVNATQSGALDFFTIEQTGNLDFASVTQTGHDTTFFAIQQGNGAVALVTQGGTGR